MGMKKFIKILSILLIICVVVFFGYKAFKKKGSDENSTEQTETQNNVKEGQADEAPLPVKVVKIKKGDLPLRLEISAISEVRQKADIKSEVSGKVMEIKKRAGDNVKKGEIIIRIDDTEA